jgi:hypothetical protein
MFPITIGADKGDAAHSGQEEGIPSARGKALGIGALEGCLSTGLCTF